MFLTGLEKIATAGGVLETALSHGADAAKSVGRGIRKGFSAGRRVLSTEAGRSTALKGATHGAIGGAAVGAATGKDEEGNWSPLSGAAKGAVGGGLAGGLASVGHQAYGATKRLGTALRTPPTQPKKK